MMDLKKIRKQLHQHPERSGQEEKTAKYILKQLREIGVDRIHHQFSQHSILAELNTQQSGKTILFRCELDALPIQEKNNFDHRSQNEGTSHKCGHDGHMSMILGLAEQLVENPPTGGRFLLLFQSAEETGEGAASILASEFLDQFEIDHAFALHNVPGYPRGSIVCKPNGFTPSVESFEVQLEGATSHAGEPDKGVNPARCIAEIVEYMHSLHHANQHSENYFVVAPVHINMGEKAYGTTAGHATIGYTVRTFEHEQLLAYKNKIAQKVEALATRHQLTPTITWKEAFAANKNDPRVVQTIKQIAKDKELAYIEKEQPFDWGEDFGIFTQRISGAMFGLGAGKSTPPLHDAHYDFPDDIASTGILVFYELAKTLNE